jgi:hypothetical protein
MYVFDRSVRRNGRQIFVVDRDQRRGIPTLDTFLALNFSMADGTVMSDAKLSSIPVKILYTLSAIDNIHTHFEANSQVIIIKKH